MNTKLIIKYETKQGVAGEIIEFHNNSEAAYTASGNITKKLGFDITIKSIQFVPVKKHLELAPVIKLTQVNKNYSEVK